MDQETRAYLDNFSRDVIVRLGAVERETTQLRLMFDEESPTRATVKFARDQAGTAFIGVLELRKLWQKDSQRRSNVTRIVVAAIAALSLITVGASSFIGNLSAARIELQAGDIVRRENVACETRIEAREEKLIERVVEKTIAARDKQIDRIGR